jgi:alpha-tubulin suppressor-like RCC1 family protein
LGDGTFNGRNVPEEIVSSNVIAIAAGQFHSLFLKSDGSLWGMGRNDGGQLGTGVYTSRSPFGIASQYEIMTNGVTAIAAGYGDSLFVKSDGSLWGTGNNYTNRPTEIMDSNVMAVAAGGFDLFLEKNSTLWSMSFGFGNPQMLASNVTTMAQGYIFTMFVKSDGTLWAVGNNQYGQLGDGTTNNAAAPEQIKIPITVQFTGAPAAGLEPLPVQFNCPGIDSSGSTLVNWNWNFGDGTTSTNQNPAHTYITNGVFNPTLTASNSAGFAVLGFGPSITVTATPPVAVFSPLTNGEVVSNLASIGGWVSYNFSLASMVDFSIHELDINGGVGR